MNKFWWPLERQMFVRKHVADFLKICNRKNTFAYFTFYI